MAFQLRILSGKHKGAELRLETRRYSLGSSEENSLILSDSNIEKKHISFFFAEGKISVLSADGGLLVDGVNIDKFPIDVTPLQVMTLAYTERKNNAQNITLDNNVSIAFRETRAEDGFAERDGEVENAKTNAEDWPDEKKIEELLLKNNQLKNSKSNSQKTRQAEKKFDALTRMSSDNKQIIVRSSIAIIVLTAVIALVSIASLLWLDPVRWQAQRMKKIEQRLEKELAEKPQDKRTVRIAQQKDGTFVLLGYVETEKELVRLRGLAFESGLQIRVVSKEQLLAAIEVIAKQYNLYANFKLTPIGKASTIETRNIDNRPNVAGERKRGDTLYSFEDLQAGSAKLIDAEEFNKLREIETQHFKLRAEGFVQHERKIRTFRKVILQDLPYIKEVEMDVTTNEVMLETIRNALSKNIAFSGVQLDLQLGQLVMSGAIFANFHDELQDILQEQYTKLPRAPISKDRITLAPPFYAKITALLLGRQRAVDLRLRKDSAPKRYLVGQIIDNDKQVIAIANNGIILNYRDKTLGFPISETAASLSNLPPANLPAANLPAANLPAANLPAANLPADPNRNAPAGASTIAPNASEQKINSGENGRAENGGAENGGAENQVKEKPQESVQESIQKPAEVIP